MRHREWQRVRPNGHSSALPRPATDRGRHSHACGLWRPLYSAESGTEFAEDSSLEGAGFKPSVPLRRRRPERKGRIDTFGRALQQFGRRALVNFIALMGNYAETAALLTVFDMQLGPDQQLPLPQL